MKNYKEIFEHLVTQTQDYLERNGLKSMILGISGGIDSTVCAVICREVSRRMDRKIKFIGASLPSKTNEKDEQSTATSIGVLFCDSFREKDIQRIYEFVSSGFSGHLGDPKQTSIANGNIKARLRMIYLYNLASLYHGIVIDTDQLTENSLGFWTIHGDEGDFDIIGDLWKTEVYELADWMVSEYLIDEREKEAVKNSIGLVPTDGNGVMPGGDLAQIAPGFTYPQVEEVLKAYVGKENPDLAPLIEKYGEEMVIRVTDRVNASRFKRKHRPFVISMTPDSEGNYIREK